MATNIYFSQKVKSEQNLYEDIIIESLKIYGQDIYYLPRDIIREDRILGDDIQSSFNSSYRIEMYIQNTEGFDGEGDLFTKFGVQIRDQATFIVSRKRWNAVVSRYDNEINSVRPREGDLIYLPLSNSLFQIMHVEHDQPFYQLSNLPTYKMRCELFEYSGESLDTGHGDIDEIEERYNYKYVLTLSSLRSRATAGVGISLNGAIVQVNLLDSGDGYFYAPPITITTTGVGSGAIIRSLIDSDLGKITGFNIINGGGGYLDAATIIDSPDNPVFLVGETVRQTLSDGTIITGEVVNWNDSDYKLEVVGVGGDDGEFHSLVNGPIYGLTSLAAGRITSVAEVNQLSENEQNEDFGTNNLDFLDFTEDNPFGDPR
jgi:hypothetical protein